MRALVVAIAVLASARPADACSCGRLSTCEAYWLADAVFTGTITASTIKQGKQGQFHIEKGPDGKPITVIGPSGNITLAVDQVFRGTVGKTVEAGIDGMCTFVDGKVGEKLFVYAALEQGKLVIRACMGTTHLDDADEDLDYARNHAGRGGNGTVSGEVAHRDEDGTHELVVASVKLRGVPQSPIAQTNKRGEFKLTAPPGTYGIEAIAPGYRMDGAPQVRIAAPGACASVQILMVLPGVAKGRLLDHQGKPAAKIEVVARSTDPKNAWARHVQSTPDGSFVADDLPENESFHLVVSPKGPTTDQPYPTRYFPDATTTTGAKTFTTNATRPVERVDFTLPPPLPVFTSTVRVTAKNRLADVFVHIKGPGVEETFYPEEGPFDVRHFAGTFTIDVCKTRKAREICKTITKKLAGDTKLRLVAP